jgi:hypothetical protein
VCNARVDMLAMLVMVADVLVAIFRTLATAFLPNKERRLFIDAPWKKRRS